MAVSTGHRATRSDSGFTLFEMLVTLALMALIAGFIAGGLQFGRRTWEATRQIDRLAPSLAVREVLRSGLAGTLAIPSVASDQSLTLGFSGTSSAVEFIAVAPGQARQDGLEKWRLAFTGGRSLTLERADFAQRVPGGGVAGADMRHVLLEGVESLAIRYFGATGDGEAKQWHRAWNRSDRLPELIGIALTFPDGDLRSWPELIVDIRAGG